MTRSKARAGSPIALLSTADRPVLYLLGLLSALKAVGLVGLAWALAHGIVAVIDGTDAWRTAVAVGLGCAMLRAVVAWAHNALSARAALGAKERLRARLAEAAVRDPHVNEGSLTTLATHGLDALDDYFTVFLPATVSAATIPLLAGAAILSADWVSALIIVLTVPLVPLFMALIGVHTQERVSAAADALARFSDHLVELARGLPVLVGLGRSREQADALHRIAQRQHHTTLQTLKTAFLSSLALELISTISVAVVAVFIGVRLVYGELDLTVGLFALLLAPECFAPFRDVGAAYHASDDGREALRRATAIVDTPRPERAAGGGSLPLAVRNLTVRYPERSGAAVNDVSFDAGPGKLTLLDGRSGAGKSTVFAVLNGRISDGAHGVEVEGNLTGLRHGGTAWLPQRPVVAADTVELELENFAATDAAALLRRVGIAHRAGAHPAQLSPGELRRLAFARVLARVDAGAELVLLDEPTAHLDAHSAAVIVRLIRELRARGDVAIIAASHDDRVRALADARVVLGATRDAVAEDLPAAVRASTGEQRLRQTTAGRRAHPVRELVAFLRPVAARFAFAAILGTLAALFAVSLTAVSAWLIVRASEQPPILHLMVAIVGVRFFGLGRAVLRYWERLQTHDAVFAAVTGLRMRLWNGLAGSGVVNRAALQGGRALSRLVHDADQVRDLAVRVVQPVLVGVLTSAAVLIAVAIIHPDAVGAFLLAILIALVVAPTAALLTDRAATRSQSLLRSQVMQRFAALVAASDDLSGNGVDDRMRSELAGLDARASATARRGALALGAGNAIVVLVFCALAALTFAITAPAAASGALQPGLVAVLALLPLGLIEPVLELVAAVQQAPALRDALSRVSTTTTDAMPERAADAPPIHSITLDDLSVRWPDAPAPAFTGVSATLTGGDWLTVTGPSGAGKSTLLLTLLGQLRPEGGRYLVNGRDTAGLDPALLRERIAWCPQEGHLFNSTLRGNLTIARDRTDAPDDTELTGVLRRVGLGELLERLPLGLDTPIGAAGSRLSGGERQRVAVARTLLAPADVVLIDEPTAHLDSASAEALMADLRTALADRIVVLVTHDASVSGERLSLN